MTPDEFLEFYGRLRTAFVLASPDGRILHVNSSAAELLGRSASELAGLRLTDIAATSPASLEAFLRNCASSAEFLPGSLVVRIGQSEVPVRCDGARTPSGPEILLQLTPRSESVGRFLALTEKVDQLAVEIAERRRTESLIREHNEVLSMVARDQPLESVLIRLVRTAETFAGQPVSISLQPGGSPDSASSELIRSASGRLMGAVTMSATSAAGPGARQRELLELCAHTAGIALERYAAQKEAREMIAQQSAMLDGLPARIALLDSSGQIRSVNRSWTTWTDSSDLLGERLGPGAFLPAGADGVLRLTSAPPGTTLTSAVREVSDGVVPFFSAECAHGYDPGITWFQLTIAPVPRNGKPPHEMVLMLVDITDRKLAEDAIVAQATELGRMNSELQQFAWVASHDLREPLRTVKSFAQLLVLRYREQLGPEADQYLDYISEGVTRMDRLIADLLVYSRAVHDSELPRTPVSLSGVLTRATQNLRAAIEESGARITADRLPVVTGNESLLVQLFQNLISNSIKYRSSETPRISVTATQVQPGWRISVADNGIGIDPKYHESIFGLFKRLHPRATPGTGIGLTLCRKIVEAHGGSIRVESSPGQGATFHFELDDAG